MRLVPTINGMVVGTVANLDDPENLARVQVKFAFLGDQVSRWAKLVCLSAGKDRGTLFRPEIEDEVLIGFELGDPDRPYVLGSLWNRTDQPPAMGEPGAANNWRVIKSRSGHILKFNDENGAETIEIRDKDDMRTVVIDSANEKIEVVCDGSNGTVSIEVPNGQMTVDAQKNISLVCSAGDIALKADGGGKVQVDSTAGDVCVNASAGSVKVSAVQVEVQAEAAMSLKAGAEMNIESSGLLNLKGSLININ